MMLRYMMVCVGLMWVVPVSAQTLLSTLPNGMKVLVKEDKRAPVVAVRLWYKVGSVDEHEGKTGLSHALEHMMFKGTPAVPAGEFSRRIAALGGNDNAYTNRTETVYTTNIAVRHLDEVLKMEADRMVNLNFSDRDFDNEMSVIREERRMRVDDSSNGKMWETLNAHLWQKPFNRASIIGYMADLHQLKADDLRTWYRQWYAPNNAMMVIVGDVDAKQATAKVAQFFGKIPARTLPARHDEAEAPQEARASQNTVVSVTAQPLFNLSWRVPKQTSVRDSEAYALDMLALVLSGTDSARYDKKLVRGEALALGVSVGYNDYGRKNAMFSIAAMPAAQVSPEQLKQRLLAEIQDIAEKGIDKQELALVRTPLEAERIFAKDSVQHQADQLGDLEHNGFGYQTEDEQLKRLLAVTPKQVQYAAQRLLQFPVNQVTVVPPSSESMKP